MEPGKALGVFQTPSFYAGRTMRIGGFQRFTLSDYPGKPSAIIFTQGCNFRCPYCHNRQLWTETGDRAQRYTAEAIFDFLSQRKGLLQGVVITGGDAERLLPLLRRTPRYDRHLVLKGIALVARDMLCGT